MHLGQKDVVRESDIQMGMAIQMSLLAALTWNCFNEHGIRNTEAVLKDKEAVLRNTEVVLMYIALLAIDRHVMEKIVSRLLASIILNKAARHVEKVTKDGILKQKEAHPYIVEIDHALHHLEEESDRDS
eukprot:gene12812-7453_t